MCEFRFVRTTAPVRIMSSHNTFITYAPYSSHIRLYSVFYLEFSIYAIAFVAYSLRYVPSSIHLLFSKCGIFCSLTACLALVEFASHSNKFPSFSSTRMLAKSLRPQHWKNPFECKRSLQNNQNAISKQSQKHTSETADCDATPQAQCNYHKRCANIHRSNTKIISYRRQCL